MHVHPLGRPPAFARRDEVAGVHETIAAGFLGFTEVVVAAALEPHFEFFLLLLGVDRMKKLDINFVLRVEIWRGGAVSGGKSCHDFGGSSGGSLSLDLLEGMGGKERY